METKPIGILLVEDNPDDADLLKEALAEAHAQCRLTRVERLEEALRHGEQERFDLVLLDLSLPDSQGLETFTRLCACCPEVAIVVLSGTDDEDLALRAVQAGAQDYLVKGTMDGHLLARAMRYAIERKRGEERTKEALREKEVLLKEIHHRVKNNLQLIASLLSMQARRLTDETDVAEVFADTQSRVQSMALIHERLYRSDSLAEVEFESYVRALVNELLPSYSPHPERVTLDLKVEDVELDIDTAVPCGLIVNELVANALKHAFPDGRKGTIGIAFARAGEGLLLRVRDDGVGLPEELDVDRVPSLGLRLVRILSEQLEGEVTFNANGRGTEVAIRMPLPVTEKG